MKGLTDLWFAAFLKIKGYKLSNFEAVGPKKIRFFFEISEEDYKKERVAFFKSEYSQYKQVIEELKDLVF